MYTPTTSVVMMVVITISCGDDADTKGVRKVDGVIAMGSRSDEHTDSDRDDDGGDHYQQWR
jgi:hypothetical protein